MLLRCLSLSGDAMTCPNDVTSDLEYGSEFVHVLENPRVLVYQLRLIIAASFWDTRGRVCSLLISMISGYRASGGNKRCWGVHDSLWGRDSGTPGMGGAVASPCRRFPGHWAGNMRHRSVRPSMGPRVLLDMVGTPRFSAKRGLLLP